MADLNILRDSIRLVESKIFRDFMELENLQSSNKTIAFTNATLEYARKRLFNFFLEKRPNYSLIIRDYSDNIVDRSEYSIYVNCISGIKNFAHGIPYFSTILSLKKSGKTIMGVVNNYAEKTMFYTTEGGGSFVNNKRIRVSNRNILNETIVAVKQGMDRELLSKLMSKLPTLRVNNCYVLDSCHTACGKYDCNIIFDGIREEIDVGALFIKESGGLVRYLNEGKTNCFFSNSLIFDRIGDVLVD
ncbi:MAG: hypothetical protein LBS34_02485 [Rickettsiales bacterium]|jgi:myo-inositol-1(or 4)-monophosphatase|nr:hypothetical protein [Rickettsiales bacterium]